MNIKTTITILLLIYANTLFSQETNLVFNVVKPEVKIALSPSYNYLYKNIAHPINIEVEDTTMRYITKLAGGTINATDSGTFITPEISKEVILNVYQLKDGKEILVGSKKYYVLPEPKPYLRGKSTDNVLQDMLLVSGVLKGISIYKGKKLAVEVKSFTVVFKNERDAFTSVKVVGNQIPIPTRKEITKLADGSLIYFEDIMIELMPGNNVLIQPYRVTMQVIESKDVTGIGIGTNK